MTVSRGDLVGGHGVPTIGRVTGVPGGGGRVDVRNRRANTRVAGRRSGHGRLRDPLERDDDLLVRRQVGTGVPGQLHSQRIRRVDGGIRGRDLGTIQRDHRGTGLVGPVRRQDIAHLHRVGRRTGVAGARVSHLDSPRIRIVDVGQVRRGLLLDLHVRQHRSDHCVGGDRPVRADVRVARVGCQAGPLECADNVRLRGCRVALEFGGIGVLLGATDSQRVDNRPRDGHLASGRAGCVSTHRSGPGVHDRDAIGNAVAHCDLEGGAGGHPTRSLRVGDVDRVSERVVRQGGDRVLAVDQFPDSQVRLGQREGRVVRTDRLGRILRLRQRRWLRRVAESRAGRVGPRHPGGVLRQVADAGRVRDPDDPVLILVGQRVERPADLLACGAGTPRIGAEERGTETGGAVHRIRVVAVRGGAPERDVRDVGVVDVRRQGVKHHEVGVRGIRQFRVDRVGDRFADRRDRRRRRSCRSMLR